MELLYLPCCCIELLFYGTEHHVRVVNTDHGLIRGNNHHIKIIYLLEFSSLSICCTGHTGKLFIHTEEVLKGDGGKGLVLTFNLDPFLCLKGLMQAVTVASSRHDTPGKFIYNDYLAILHNVVNVLLEKGMGLERLLNMVQYLGIHRIIEIVHTKHLLHKHHAFVCKGCGPCLFINSKVGILLE